MSCNCKGSKTIEKVEDLLEIKNSNTASVIEKIVMFFTKFLLVIIGVLSVPFLMVHVLFSIIFKDGVVNIKYPKKILGMEV